MNWFERLRCRLQVRWWLLTGEIVPVTKQELLEILENGVVAVIRCPMLVSECKSPRWYWRAYHSIRGKFASR